MGRLVIYERARPLLGIAPILCSFALAKLSLTVTIAVLAFRKLLVGTYQNARRRSHHFFLGASGQ
ncbi:hypothetical protein BST63_35555 [Bradyrhizobium canariense]|uniref:Uncharacterized protein n=1 Tax=Bradyrhizobium canariense TaxID=255045 RepID=A0ABX3WSI8_9BRAD|nr:hypothetical protein BSR47_31845 [Bradyrhizobium canariense]OSJ21048.1 hypothetical protein BST63_35555 [Bradyrhizobium canariense]